MKNQLILLIMIAISFVGCHDSMNEPDNLEENINQEEEVVDLRNEGDEEFIVDQYKLNSHTLVDTSEDYKIEFKLTMLDTTTSIVDTHKVFLEDLSDTTYYVKVYDGHDQDENFVFKGKFELDYNENGELDDVSVIPDTGFGDEVSKDPFTHCVKRIYMDLKEGCNSVPECWFACKAANTVGGLLPTGIDCDDIMFGVSIVYCLFNN